MCSKKKVSQDYLFELCDKATAFVDDTGIVRVVLNGNPYPIDAVEIRDFLCGRYFVEFRDIPTETAVKKALSYLKMKAREKKERHKTYMRVARMPNETHIRVAPDTKRRYIINAEGWKTSNLVKPYIALGPTAESLPIASDDGDINDLIELLPTTYDESILLVAWIVYCLTGANVYPCLVFEGPGGRGKSTLALLVRHFVDPDSVPSMQHGTIDNLLVHAVNRYVVFVDNMSTLKPKESDTFCLLSTGGSITKRTNYSNTGETAISLLRPVIFTGVEKFVQRSDLGQRCIFIEPQRDSEISNESPEIILARVKDRGPSIMAALLKGVSAYYALRDKVSLEDRPRMVDFSILGDTLEATYGWKKGSFQKAYRRNQKKQAQYEVESDIVARGIAYLLMRNGNIVSETPNKLLSMLKREYKRRFGFVPSGIPDSASRFGKHINRIGPSLTRVGIKVTYKHSGDRRYTFSTKTSKAKKKESGKISKPDKNRSSENMHPRKVKRIASKVPNSKPRRRHKQQ